MGEQWNKETAGVEGLVYAGYKNIYLNSSGEEARSLNINSADSHVRLSSHRSMMVESYKGCAGVLMTSPNSFGQLAGRQWKFLSCAACLSSVRRTFKTGDAAVVGKVSF